MRENMGLYRGKTLDTGEWVTGFYVNCHGPGCNPNETRHYIVSYPGEWHEVYTSTVGEDTGLTDKNGKRIFEGDVVATANGKPHEVMFADGEFFMDGTSIPIKWVCKFEVIGNVHDNPELKGD